MDAFEVFDCCTGLMLPLASKSVEPKATGLEPLHMRVRHRVTPALGIERIRLFLNRYIR